jgi:hypothetical protein
MIIMVSILEVQGLTMDSIDHDVAAKKMYKSKA